jgi:hypothetical protein
MQNPNQLFSNWLPARKRCKWHYLSSDSGMSQRCEMPCGGTGKPIMHQNSAPSYKTTRRNRTWYAPDTRLIDAGGYPETA